MTVKKASTKDNEILTEITKKSKAYWGYSEEQILAWNVSLTISKDFIENNYVFKLLKDNKIIGYYAYVDIECDNVKLDSLFILPEYIGKGFGRFLVTDFLNRMRNDKCERILVDSDPNAEAFYVKLGFTRIGEFETSVPKRIMPILEMTL